jgi:signal transduction histidine kinase
MIDPRTAMVCIALMYVVLSINTWVYLDETKRTSVRIWCAAGLVGGLSILSYALRGYIPEFACVLLGNGLLVVAMSSGAYALRLESRPWPLGVLVAVLAADITAIGIAQFLELGMLSGLINRMSVASAALAVAWSAFQVGRDARSINAYTISAAYAAVCVVFVIQSVVTVIHGDFSPMSGGITPLLPVFVGLIAAVVNHISFLGMAFDRSVSLRLQSADDLARATQRQTLGQEVAALDADRSIAMLAASLAHELNQPLAAALANAQVLRRNLGKNITEPEDIAGMLRSISADARRALHTLQGFRRMGVDAPAASEQAEAGALLESAIARLTPALLAGSVTLRRNPPPPHTWVMGGEVQLSQVLLNVIRNAIEAMEGCVTRELLLEGALDEDGVILRVSDTGVGMSEEQVSRVGESFNTTKAEGLGMGLAISVHLLKECGGTLRAFNLPKGGLCIEIRLVRAPGPGRMTA